MPVFFRYHWFNRSNFGWLFSKKKSLELFYYPIISLGILSKTFCNCLCYLPAGII